MPALDRRIVVRRSAFAGRSGGQAQSVDRDFPVWATRLDASLIDAATEGGSLETGSRSYVVRWRVDFTEWTREAWAADGSYERGHVVRHAGLPWAATRDNPTGAPSELNDDWECQPNVVPVGQLSVIESGIVFGVENLVEQAAERDERRRFLRIEVAGEII